MIKVQIHAPINPTGVGTHAQYLLSELIRLHGNKIDLFICPTGMVKYSTKREIRDQISDHLIRQKAFEPEVIIVLDVPRKCVQWYNDNKFAKGNATVIAYTVFELEVIGPKFSSSADKYRNELYDLNVFEEIWVPSTWCRDILKNQVGSIPDVKVVPEGIADFNILATSHNRNVPVFGNVGKFERRKGHYAILDALEKFDKEGTKVSFVGWWHNFWDKDSLRTRLLKSNWVLENSGVGGITFCSPNRNVSLYLPAHETWQEDMVQSLCRVDYMVYPVFAEGWGLPVGDSIGLGIPTLCTGNTGTRDFFEPYALALSGYTKENYNIASMGTEVADDPPFFSKQGRWEATNGDCVYAAMQRRMLTHPSRRDYISALQNISIEMKKAFSWKKSAEALLKSLGASPF